MEQNYSFGKTILVQVSCELPEFTTEFDKKTVKRLNDFYMYYQKQLLRYAKDVMYKEALARFKLNTAEGYPFLPSELRITHFISYNEKGILSVVLDRYEFYGGANGTTIRSADNWLTSDGTPIPRLFPRNANKRVIDACTRMALAWQQSGVHYYFEELPRNMRKYFRADQSYLTPEGLAVFYQEVTISPHSEGIPVFVLAMGPEL